jgi:hypothetical protein
MTTKIKIKFIKECAGLINKGVTAVPLCNYYTSTKTCCDKIGELSLMCDNKCKNLRIEVQEGLIFDSENQNGTQGWTPTLDLSRSALNGKMEGKWYVRTRDQNKINLIIRETLNEDFNNEERSFALELEAPETEEEKIIDESPILPIHYSAPYSPLKKAHSLGFDDIPVRKSLSLNHTHSTGDLSTFPLTNEEFGIPPIRNLFESDSDSDNEINDELSRLSIEEIMELSPSSTRRVCSSIKKPKLKRQIAGVYVDNMKKNNSIDDISLLTTSSPSLSAASSYSSLHEDYLANAMI